MKNSNFCKFPKIKVEGHHCAVGWEEISKTLGNRLNSINKLKKVVALETYHGVFEEEIISGLQLADVSVVRTQACFKTEEEISCMVQEFVTDDPVFGFVSPLELDAFIDQNKLSRLTDDILAADVAVVLVVGPGASLVYPGYDLLVYADMPRWEIQLRFRKNQIANLGAANHHDIFSYQYKRAFYVDWKVLDRHKKTLMDRWDEVLDTTIPGSPRMISGAAMKVALEATINRPFRVIPFFDPGPWGGQWLKEVCDLDRSAVNYAWGFDCVPEENSLMFDFNGNTVEIPSVNLVYAHPRSLLGNKVFDAFGAEFPIRFDFLDTMEGGNLSLQVHPLHEYMKENFGMPYTQNESYYFLDAGDDAFVYLGLKEGTDTSKMWEELEVANEFGEPFDAEKYVEKWPVKKHDHALIPAGTIHCSGADSVVLEISATPFNFTFKLWDWGRTGLDGHPRPISLEHGKNNVVEERTTHWTSHHLLNQVEIVGFGDGWREERTGLDEHSFIETRRHWFTQPVTHHTNGIVNVLNLIEGREAIVESPDNAFEPFVIHYAETFIVPAAVGTYTVRPYGESDGKQIGTIKASVRTENLGDFKG